MQYSPNRYDHAGTNEFQAWIEAMFASVSHDFDPLMPYVEFSDWTRCRDAELDIRVAKEQTWERFLKRVCRYLEDKTPDMKLFWRMIPEDNLQDSYVVVKYDENGPDKDFCTDRRCHADKGWKDYAVYARFAVASAG